MSMQRAHLAGTRAMTMADFLEWEEQEDLRYEFDGTRVIAVIGAAARHHMVIDSMNMALHEQLPNECQVFRESFKLQTEKGYRYPDLMVVCTPLDPDATLTTEATFVAEVLSPSTTVTDLHPKLWEYDRIQQVQAYLVVDPLARSYNLFTRGQQGFLRQGKMLDETKLPFPMDHLLEHLFDGLPEV